MVKGPGYGKSWSQVKSAIKMRKLRSFYRSSKGKAARVQAYAGRKYRR